MVVDRIVKQRVLDTLRAKNFRTVKEIASATGMDFQLVKEAAQELIDE